MRVVRGLGLAAGLIVGGLALPPPAQSAPQSAVIVAGATAGVSAGGTYWIARGCTAEHARTVNGKSDAVIFSVAGRPVGTVLNVRWSGVISPTASLSPMLFAGCSPVSTTGITGTTGGTGLASGAFKVPIKSPVQWLVVEGNGPIANMSVTLD